MGYRLRLGMFLAGILVVAARNAAQGAADEARIRVTGVDGTTELTRPPGSSVTMGSQGAGAPVVVYGPGTTDTAERIIVELRGAPLVARGGGRARSAHLDLAALASEHDRVREEVVRLQGLRSAARGAVHREFSLAFNGMAVSVSPATRSALAGHPDVQAIHADREVHAVLDTSVPFVGAPAFWATHGGYRGAGQVIAVIDTGIDYGHPDLGGCVAIGAGCKVIGGYDFSNDDNDPRDDNGHGTHVASIAAGNGPRPGVAPDASLLAYKVLAAHGGGLTSDVIAAIEAAVDPNGDLDTSDHADVINLSLGGPGSADDPASQAVDGATAAGVVVVVAAGNNGAYLSIGSPGTARTALTVGAVDESPALAEFSSRGPVAPAFEVKPELAAPGIGICAAKAAGTQLGGDCIDATHVSADGTSMATPFVAGGAALLRGLRPSLGPADLKSLLVNNAAPTSASALDVGGGVLDLPAAGAAHTVLDPATLTFGRDDVSQALWKPRRTLTIRNLDDAARAYTVAAGSRGFGLPAGATVAISPSTFSLAAGESIDVDLELTVDNALAANRTTAPYSYEGSITVQAGAETQQVPFIFLKTPLLRVHTDEIATLITVLDPVANSSVSVQPVGTVTDVFVPNGTYDVMAFFVGYTAYVLHEGIEVQEEHDDFISVAEAAHEVRLTGIDQAGMSLASTVRYHALFNRQMATGILTVQQGDGADVVARSNSFGATYGFDLAMLGNVARDGYLITKSAVGVSSDLTLSNTPAELTLGDVRYRSRPGEIGTGAMDFLVLDFGWLQWGFGSVVPDVDRRIRMTTMDQLVLSLFYRPVLATTLGGHGGPMYRTPTRGLIEAFNPRPDIPVYRTTTGELPLNLGPAWFFGRVRSSPDAVGIWPQAGNWLWTFHDQGGDGPDAPNQVVGWWLWSGTSLAASGFAPQDSSNSPGHAPYAFGLAPGPYTFETDPLPYWVGGAAATTRVTATFDSSRWLSGGDADPPYLSAVTVRTRGRLTDVVTLGETATLGFVVHDGEDEMSTTLAVARVDEGVETPVPLISLGGGAFEAAIPCTAAGPVDLVLTAADGADNELRQWLTPAFVCGTFTCTELGDADGDGDGVCDLEDPCTNIDRGRNFISRPHTSLKLTNLMPGGPTDNDTITLRGSFTLPSSVALGELQPQLEGARLVLRDGLGLTRVDVVLPPGLAGPGTRRGWRPTRGLGSWRYWDRSIHPLGGITKLTISPAHLYALSTRGAPVTVRLSGKRGNFPFASAPLPVNATIVVGDQNAAAAGKCGESAFVSPDCELDASRGYLSCRR